MTRRHGKVAAAVCVLVLFGAIGCGGGGGDDDSGGPNTDSSVCGGSVTSVPKVCSLEARDAGVSGGVRYLTFRYCLSDREGDIDSVCAGVAVNGVVDTECALVSPPGTLINECQETDPIAIGPTGVVNVWTVAIDVGDRAGNVSNVASTQFSCCS